MTVFRGVRAATLGLALAVAACSDGTNAPPSQPTPPAPPEPATVRATATPTPAGAPRPATGDVPGIVLEVVVEGLSSPVGVAADPHDPDRLYVIEQGGRVRFVEDGRLAAAPMLDIADRITAGGERGLLGIALHPGFPDDPRLYLNYTDAAGDTVVSELRRAQSATAIDEASERVLLRVDQPYPNHNGGALAFGPDGFLWVATGDGGSGGDPGDRAERLDTLLGKILRIDVRPAGDRPYSIPPDNPFVGNPSARPEIAHLGLRNPWRIAFDRATGDLWIGDVGQNRFEELDVARAGSLGLDFGWDRLEGRTCFEPERGCDPGGLTPPIAVYGREHGCSIVGGPVARASGVPGLDGTALFADVCSGLIFGVDADGPADQEPVVLLESGRPIASLGEDAAGRILAVDLGGGAVVRVVPST